MCVSDDVQSYAGFLQALQGAGLLIPSGVRGVYGRSTEFERVIAGFERYASRASEHLAPDGMQFPPLLDRAVYRKLSHIQSFPDLMGSVHSFRGGDREHEAMLQRFHGGEDWTRDLVPTDVMMAPAACYPVYPMVAGTLGTGGRTIELNSWVFRHEPSDDPARMQIFKMRELVRVGTAEQAQTFRANWLERGIEMLEAIGLPVRLEVANDPFFGRGGRLAKATQREQVLKHEFVVPICSTERPTAVGSCNYHVDYFGNTFGIRDENGATAHTACFAFGLERVTLALFKTHGLRTAAWPSAVREELGLA